jgi:CRP/FNR family transcriptional regulator, cyclic AMP receptor protein
MTRLAGARLIDVEPDLIRFLPPEDREQAGALVVPVIAVDEGDLDLGRLQEHTSAFGVLVLDGMLLRRVLVGDHSALRVLGPGDIVAVGESADIAILEDGGHRVGARTRLAVLEDHVLLAMRRFPQLAVGMQLRLAAQQERLAAQLVICQLPRVEDRILAMMWLLAETWGRVTSVGTSLPLSLTHDAWGELVGAKRPTVTLALQKLVEVGAAARLDRGWLLLEVLERDDNGADRRSPRSGQLSVINEGRSAWESEPEPGAQTERNQGLQETVEALRAAFERNVAEHGARTELTIALRARSRELRTRLREQRVS